MGLGTQMIAWHEDFCHELAERGLYVMRFDNRDIGRSTHVRGRPPNVPQLAASLAGARAVYTLADMAEDAAGLLRELELAPAHVIGASMGGMIAQTLAARDPQAVRSLVSIMSNTGNRFSGQPSLRVYDAVLRRAAARARGVHRRTWRPSSARSARRACRATPPTSARSPAPATTATTTPPAPVASSPRSSPRATAPPSCARIDGAHARDPRRRADRLVSPSGGRATARAIPGARLMSVPGMGHDLPRARGRQLIDAIADHTRSADASARVGEEQHSSLPGTR